MRVETPSTGTVHQLEEGAIPEWLLCGNPPDGYKVTAKPLSCRYCTRKVERMKPLRIRKVI